MYIAKACNFRKNLSNKIYDQKMSKTDSTPSVLLRACEFTILGFKFCTSLHYTFGNTKCF